MKLIPPSTVRDIAARLERAGFEAWCVGGAVRDALLGHEHLDWDLATSARPDQVRKLFRRTVPIGVEFGTVGVFDSEGIMHEVTTFRHDVETDGRHARVKFGASLDEDLARRDFTINAIAYSPSRDEIRDPFGGREDLRVGVVRTVGDPDARFMEDRLRALRALRFAARFGFRIEERTWESVGRCAGFLDILSAERIKQEIEKTMEQVERPSQAFRLWRDSGALAHLIPALASASDWELSRPDFVRRPVLAGRPGRRSDRLAALFVSADASAVEGALRKLRFSNADVGWIAGQVLRARSEGPELEAAVATGELPSAEFMRRMVARIGRLRTASFLRINFANWCARAAAGFDAPGMMLGRRLYRAMVRTAFHDPVELSDLAVDGDDLRALGVPPGPAIGLLLSSLLDAVLADPGRNDREGLLRLAKLRLQQPNASQGGDVGALNA